MTNKHGFSPKNHQVDWADEAAQNCVTQLREVSVSHFKGDWLAALGVPEGEARKFIVIINSQFVNCELPVGNLWFRGCLLPAEWEGKVRADYCAFKEERNFNPDADVNWMDARGSSGEMPSIVPRDINIVTKISSNFVERPEWCKLLSESFAQTEPVAVPETKLNRAIFEACKHFLLCCDGSGKNYDSIFYDADSEFSVSIHELAEKLGIVKCTGNRCWSLLPQVRDEIDAVYRKYALLMLAAAQAAPEQEKGL